MYLQAQNYLGNLFKHLNDTSISFYVLYYDDYTSRMLNIFTIKQLREFNIVDIKHINQLDRSDSIIDLTAIFYISHSNSNTFITHLNDFCKSVLFIHYTLTNSESFADQLSRSSTDNITLLYDTYTHYIVFDLYGMSCPPLKQNTMQLLNNQLLMDKQLLTSSIQSISSFYMTMGVIPLIYTIDNPNCQYIASECHDLFVQWNQEYAHLKSNKSTNFYDKFELYSGYGGQRPILLILNRSQDILSFLMHSWSYNVLVHDLLKLNQNQILLQQSLPTATAIPATVDIDPLDQIWQQHSSNPFPVVAEEIDKQLQQYKVKAQEMMAFAGVSNINDVQLDQMSNTAHIKTILTQLPELTQQKHILDNHMHVATGLLNKMQTIQLDKVFEYEETIVKLTISDIVSLMDKQDIRLIDRVRIALLWYLMKKTNYEDIKKCLEKVNCGVGCLDYLQTSEQHVKQQTPTVQSDLLGKFGSLGNKLSENLNTAGFNSIINSVKNLMPFDTTSGIVKITEQVINSLQGGSLPENLIELDPLHQDNQVPFGGYVFPTGVPQVFVIHLGLCLCCWGWKYIGI